MNCFYGLRIFLDVEVPNLRAMFKDGAFALTDPVMRLHRRKLWVLVALVTVFPVCGFQSSLVLRVTPRCKLLSVILKICIYIRDIFERVKLNAAIQ